MPDSKTGQYLVLEDNVRIPSGISYVLENRQVMGIELVQCLDLVGDCGIVYMRTIRGLMGAYRARNVAVANAVGKRCRR